jgi:hypothetical protein
MIVGDANEGGEPEKNQVGVSYFTDPSGACYFGDATLCPTEDGAADFDYDNLSDMQLARLPLTHRWKVARSVENFLNKAISSSPTDRALLTVGDYEWQGSSPEGLPELMDELIDEFQANGYETRYMRETDYGRYDYLEKQLDTADSLNEGVDIVVNIGTVSNRNRIAGDFIQKAVEPKWNMDWLDNSGARPFVLFGPTCDVADFDRNASIYDPILAELFLCNEPQKPAAVAWISHGRGNWGSWYRIFAEEFVTWLFSGHTIDVLDCYWKAKESCWIKHPEMHNFLRGLFYLGWPVSLKGTCTSGVEQSSPAPGSLTLMSMPNPSTSGVKLRFALPEAAAVKLQVFDVMGRLVAVLADGRYQDGWHQLTWTGRNTDGQRIAPGIYFARLSTGRQQITSKIIFRR